MTRTFTIVWLSALVACAPDAPATPSFQQDVMPILAANCLRCHAAPVIGGAPERFRLDMLEDVITGVPLLPDDDPLCQAATPDPDCLPPKIEGAATWAESAAARVDDDDRPMPPRFRIDDHQIETLQNWAAGDAQRGEPRPGNAQPQAAVESIERTAAIVHLTVRVDDPDRDVVGGSLHARIAGTDTFVGLVGSGLATVRWDTAGLAPGTYPLSARLDDGGALFVVPLGTITVEVP